MIEHSCFSQFIQEHLHRAITPSDFPMVARLPCGCRCQRRHEGETSQRNFAILPLSGLEG